MYRQYLTIAFVVLAALPLEGSCGEKLKKLLFEEYNTTLFVPNPESIRRDDFSGAYHFHSRNYKLKISVASRDLCLDSIGPETGKEKELPRKVAIRHDQIRRYISGMTYADTIPRSVNGLKGELLCFAGTGFSSGSLVGTNVFVTPIDAGKTELIVIGSYRSPEAEKDWKYILDNLKVGKGEKETTADESDLPAGLDIFGASDLQKAKDLWERIGKERAEKARAAEEKKKREEKQAVEESQRRKEAAARKRRTAAEEAANEKARKAAEARRRKEYTPVPPAELKGMDMENLDVIRAWKSYSDSVVDARMKSSSKEETSKRLQAVREKYIARLKQALSSERNSKVATKIKKLIEKAKASGKGKKKNAKANGKDKKKGNKKKK